MKDGISSDRSRLCRLMCGKPLAFRAVNFFRSEATPQSGQGTALPITNIELNGKA